MGLNSYIYTIVDDYKHRCYVGQSTKIESSADGTISYQRIYDHYKATFHDDITDASIPLFQDWPLIYLRIDVYPATGTEPYGLSKDTYEKFLKYFIKKGEAKRNYSEKEGSEVKAFLTGNSSLNLQIKSTDKTGENESIQSLSNADMIDIAEIIWISRMQYAGYQVLNRVIGGEQSGWTATLDGNKSLFNINNTSPGQLTSFLISTSQHSAGRLQQAQSELDRILDKYLTRNVGELITKRANKSKEEIKAGLANGKKVDFVGIALKEVQDTLSGKTSTKTTGIQEDLNNFVAKYSDLGIKGIDWKLKSNDSKNPDLFVLISKIIAQSLLGPRQNMTVYKNSTEEMLTLSYNGNRMVFKGSGGKDIGSSNAKPITVPIEQTLSIMTNANMQNGSNWWFDMPAGVHVKKDVKFIWARRVFKNYFRDNNRIKDASLGILAKAKAGNYNSVINLNSGDECIIIGGEPEDKSLSVKLLNEYRSHLSFNNQIIKQGYWHQFFSAMYASISRSDWSIQVDEQGYEYAILEGQSTEVNTDFGAITGVIGMKLTSGRDFITDKDYAKTVIY